MMLRLSVLVGVCGSVAALSLVSCGGNDDFVSEASTPELELDEIPDELAAAACSAYLRCIPSWTGLFGDQEQCAQTFANEFAATSYELLEDAVQQERVTYDPALGKSCVDDVRNAECAGLDLRGIESCDSAFVGSIELNGDCSINEECTGENVCIFDGDSCPGSCVPPLDAGEACLDSEQCELGLVCADDTSRCVAPAEEGEECELGEPPCATPLVCLGQNEDDGTPGRCVTHEEAFVGQQGDSCRFIGDIALCADGLACQVEDFSLEQGLIAVCRPLVERGDNCGVALPSICPTGDYCAGIDFESGELGGTCQPAPVDGEPCAEGAFAQCATGLICLEGTCNELQNNGEGCSLNVECYSANCDDGVCAPIGACQ